jgi:uncharacterized heparinase superfamily protein
MITNDGPQRGQTSGRVKLGTLLRTIRDLRPQQIFGRGRRLFPSLPISTAAAPAQREFVRLFGTPIYRPLQVRLGNQFHFLGRTGSIQQPSDWLQSGFGRLWQYNLHYFDWLKEQAAVERAADDEAWITRWIEDNDTRTGVGWEPYPTSVRIANWIIWLITIGISSPEILQSLAVQVRHLERNIEYHLLGNHILANAKALICAGAFFSGKEAERWLDKGLSLLTHELREQFFEDGGHFERSPMYHALLLEDLLDLIGIGEAYPDIRSRISGLGLRELAVRMVRWLRHVIHPDGELPYFNDCAFGIAAAPSALFEYAARRQISAPAFTRPRIAVLRDSGYATLSRSDLFCIFDCGRIGPDYLPGHAHAGTLSFELSVGEERIISNSGTSTYTPGHERHWERSTRAHSTIEIDGLDSAEIWASFRVGRKPNVGVIEVNSADTLDTVGCEHDGYAHLPGSPIHHRTVRMEDGTLRILDLVRGEGRHKLTSRFLVHPGNETRFVNDSDYLIVTPAGAKVKVGITGRVRVTKEQGRFALGFGTTVARDVLLWEADGDLPISVETEFRLV